MGKFVRIDHMSFKSYKILLVTFSVLLCGSNVIFLIGFREDQATPFLPTRMTYGPVFSATSQKDVNQRIRDICRTIPSNKYSDWTKSPDYIVAPTTNLSYCVMQYDMDDIWTRIFEIFQNFNRTKDYPLKQFPPIKEGGVGQFKRPTGKKTETLLYVRSPYARLYVAYHDRFHKVFYRQGQCENVTFQEFLDKVITHVKLRQDWGTSWFSPLVPKCRLCDVNLFSVIKEEHFAQDINEFTQKLSRTYTETVKALEFILRPNVFIQSVVLAKLKFRNPVCTYSRIGQSLWSSLQFMGLLNNSVEYPESLNDVDVAFHPNILVKAALKAGNPPLTEAEKLVQKQNILAEAYRDIKDETIKYLQEIYKYEFEMFGYSKQRPHI